MQPGFCLRSKYGPGKQESKFDVESKPLKKRLSLPGKARKQEVRRALRAPKMVVAPRKSIKKARCLQNAPHPKKGRRSPEKRARKQDVRQALRAQKYIKAKRSSPSRIRKARMFPHSGRLSSLCFSANGGPAAPMDVAVTRVSRRRVASRELKRLTPCRQHQRRNQDAGACYLLAPHWRLLVFRF